MIKKRAFVSFDEPCFFQCKHCYTYGINREKIRSIDEIVESIRTESFDVIYVSQKNDNFSDPKRGLELCERLYDEYGENLFIITRSVFPEDEVERLIQLRERMNDRHKNLFIAISINSLNKSFSSEDVSRVSTPEERIAFLKKLSEEGFTPILMLRPVFPGSMISPDEYNLIIEKSIPFISCVVASGLGVNQDVLDRLGLDEKDFVFAECQEYLQGAINCEIKFVDVSKELIQIKQFCERMNCKLFEHSMQALNYIANKLEVATHEKAVF